MLKEKIKFAGNQRIGEAGIEEHYIGSLSKKVVRYKKWARVGDVGRTKLEVEC